MKALVLAASGFQLGYVGCYGNDWIETPNLDRLAAEGVVFDQHYSDCPDPVAARRAWRTGRHPLPPLSETIAPPPDPSTPDLLALLRAAGIATSLVIDSSRPTPASFAEGWDHVRQVPRPRKKAATPLEATLAAAQEALEQLADRDHWLLWVELGTLLPPWDLPEGYASHYFTDQPDEEAGEDVPMTPLIAPTPGLLAPDDEATRQRLRRTYAGAVTWLDSGIGALADELRDQGLLDDLLLIVTTDRGLPLGAHGMVGESTPWLHEERIHLPLVMHWPGGAEAGRRVSALTQPVDLLPTLLRGFSLPVPEVHGADLRPLCRDETTSLRPYAIAGLKTGGVGEWVLRTEDWCFLLPLDVEARGTVRPPQLYVKPDDRWEVNNVLQHHLELGDQFAQVIRQFAAAAHAPGPLCYPKLQDIEAAALTGSESQGGLG